ncbi:MAG: amino acid permease, partial [Sciscionella sp.]
GLNAPAGFLAGWAILLDYLLIPTLLYVTGAAAMAAIVPAIPQTARAIIAYVLYNADIHAKIGGLIWLAIGVVIIVVRKLTGRSITLVTPQ